MRANATGLPAPAAVAAPAEAVTALYQAHALGLIRLAVVMLGDRPAAEDVVRCVRPVLIGVIKSAGRNWVGVISGNRFPPLNVPSSWARTHSAPGEIGAWVT